MESISNCLTRKMPCLEFVVVCDVIGGSGQDLCLQVGRVRVRLKLVFVCVFHVVGWPLQLHYLLRGRGLVLEAVGLLHTEHRELFKKDQSFTALLAGNYIFNREEKGSTSSKLLWEVGTSRNMQKISLLKYLEVIFSPGFNPLGRIRWELVLPVHRVHWSLDLLHFDSRARRLGRVAAAGDCPSTTS